MTRKIFKYRIPVQERSSLQIPFGYRLLDIQVQDNNLCLWAIVDLDNILQEVKIIILGTGCDYPDDTQLQYLKTVQQGICVWHIFEDY